MKLRKPSGREILGLSEERKKLPVFLINYCLVITLAFALILTILTIQRIVLGKDFLNTAISFFSVFIFIGIYIFLRKEKRRPSK